MNGLTLRRKTMMAGKGEPEPVDPRWVNNVCSLTSEDLVGAGIKEASPYINTTTSSRVSYVGQTRLDIKLSSAYRYTLTYTTTLSGETQCAVRKVTASGAVKVMAGQTLTKNTDITDSGWQSSGYTFTASDGSFLWFTLRKTDNATMNVNYFPTVTITRTEI